MSDKHRNKPLPFHSLLERNNSELNNLCQHSVFLVNLENKLLTFLKSPLNNHCKVANYSNETIILLSDSPAWAAKLRYCTPAILSYLQTECQLSSLKTIRIKVNPPASSKHSTQVRRLILSPTSAEFISQVANNMTDEKLRYSLLKIAQQQKKK